MVTVHGIGFQRAPNDAQHAPGYADALHAHSRTVLGEELGEDPERPEAGGPVYVSSEWNGSPAQGLARLDPGRALIETGKIAHVALVYSPSEPPASHPVETADALARAAMSHSHYASVVGTVRVALADAWAALHEDSHLGERSTLRPRDDIRSVHHPARLSHPAYSMEGDSSSPDPGGLGILRALEDDIATYVARNELRERVRGFVQDALLALLERDDIDTIVINAHSQGTVLCWDVLCRLPFSSWLENHHSHAARITHFVTAGSPIRKYVDMFAWGNRVGQLAAVLPSGALTWTNFCDPEDPVGDPLNPSADWRPGQPWDQAQETTDGLLVTRDSQDGSIRHASITDVKVKNIQNSSGGGLQAHDYWNNTVDFIPSLARLLNGD